MTTATAKAPSTRTDRRVNITADLSAAIDAKAASLKMTRAELVRNAVAQYTAPTTPQLNKLRSHQPQTPSKQINIRFTETEYKLISALAAQQGQKQPAYIIGLIRTILTRAPQPSAREIAALDASTRAMNAIGNNLNQIVKKMNESKTFPPGLAEAIKAVKDNMDSHAAYVDQLIKASIERWT